MSKSTRCQSCHRNKRRADFWCSVGTALGTDLAITRASYNECLQDLFAQILLNNWMREEYWRMFYAKRRAETELWRLKAKQK